MSIQYDNLFRWSWIAVGLIIGVLALALIGRGVFFYFNHRVPSIDVYDWATEPEDTHPLYFRFRADDEGYLNFSLPKYTGQLRMVATDQWKFRVPARSILYTTVTLDRNAITAIFGTLKQTIIDLGEYDYKIKRPAGNHDDEWDLLRDFLSETYPAYTSFTLGSQYLFFDYYSNDSVSITFLITEFGLALYAENIRVEGSGSPLYVRLTQGHVNDFEDAYGFSNWIEGRPINGDASAIYFFEIESPSDITNLSFFNSLIGYLASWS